MKLNTSIYLIGLILIISSCKQNEDMPEPAPEPILCIPSGLEGNVIAFYPFTNGSLDDISGNDENLTNTTTAGPTSDRNGNSSCAYVFNNDFSSTEFITTSNTVFLNNLSEFSVSLWYQPMSIIRDYGKLESLINRGAGKSCPDRNGQWSIGLYDCRKAVFGRTNSVWDHDLTNFNCQEEIDLRTNEWTHLVATFKQTGVEMKIYRNGVIQESTMGEADCSSGVPSVEDVGDLFLGKDYTGKIDDVIIFNKELTQQEVNLLFDMDVCCEE